MDNKTIQLDFKLLVAQSLNLLDSLDSASQRDALHYLLRTLKCKYPEACEQATRSLFPYIADEFASSTKTANKKQLQLQLLLTAKKEEIKTEDEGSTDLNQNFEKILCKEELMCLDEDDEDLDGDAGMDADVAGNDANAENSSSNNRRLHYSSVRVQKQDPLDLIPSSIIDTQHLTKAKYRASYQHPNVSSSARIGVDDSNNSWDAMGACDQVKKFSRLHNKNNNHNHPRLLSEKLVFRTGEQNTRVSKAEDDYFFYPDNEWTIHYHHSTGEFSVRAYKKLFRFRLQTALSEEHKPFLKQFYKNFIVSGQLMGTRPPPHVLQALREQRREEWQQMQQRKLVAAAAAATVNAHRRRLLPAIPLDSELESESESQMSSVAPQDTLKYEEIIDEGEGAERLMHGMEMGPDIEDVLGSGSSVSGSGHSNSSKGGATTDLPESVSTMVTTTNNTNTVSLVGGESMASSSLGSISNHLQQHNQQQQQGSNSLVLNGLTASNNISNLSYNSQQLANIVGDLPSLNPKEQKQQQLQCINTQNEPRCRLLINQQQNYSKQYLQGHTDQHPSSLPFPILNEVARENVATVPALDNGNNCNIIINTHGDKNGPMILPALNNSSNSSGSVADPGVDTSAMKPITESLHNNVLNTNQSHFLAHQQQQEQQRLILHNQKQDTPQQQQAHQPQQQHNLNANLQQQQTNPLTLLGGMAENAQQQLQQQQQEQLQLQQQRMQQQSSATATFINSIDNILEGSSLPAVVQQKQPQQNFNSELLAHSPSLQEQGPQQTTLTAQSQMQLQQQRLQHTLPMLHMHQQHTDALQQQQLQQQLQLQQQIASTSSACAVTTPPPASAMALTSALSACATPSSVMTGISATASTSGSISSNSLNVSLGLDENDLSHDEDDDLDDHDLDDMEPKQQLIDGGSSSSTSLQAPPGSVGGSNVAGTGAGVKKAKPCYQCLQCPKSYRKRKSLLDHYKIHPGFCHDCGQPNGTSLEEIIHHNRTIHAKEFPFVCNTCGESYSRRQQFHAHVESHSRKEFKTYSCTECGQKFPHKKLHQQHLDTTGHKADGAICEVCGADFLSKNALYQHIIRVHKKDNFFECHICQNRFTLKANLERHVQLHTEVKRTYVCDICGSSYFTYPALKDHYSNAHTDASECKCTLCGKRFGSVKSLQRHLPSHSEERPHCCCYCDQTFKWKTHLVRHKQTVHGNQPSPKKVKRFAKDEEMTPTPDMPGPPPAKITKKSNASKPKQQQQTQQQNPQQQQLQRGVSSVSTPPPLSTTPGTSQQDPFNASMISNSSSQSSTASASASQHSLSTNESQQNSMYTQNFSAEKLIGHQTQQQQQQQPQQALAQVPTQHCNPAVAVAAQHAQQQQLQQQQLQQQRPTPPPAQQQHQRRTPNTPNNGTPDGTGSSGNPSIGVGGSSNLPGNNLMSRLNNFGPPSGAGVGNVTGGPEFHFDPNHGASGGSSTANAYQQHQLINQYQQQHHQQQQAAASVAVVQQQQQHMRSHTPQSPHQPHPQQQQQHFTSPHHMPATQQQLHHHQQMLHHQHQMQQQQQQQHRHNQQRSPHHHATPTQQLQQQHHQPSHSPQRGRLQSPQPQPSQMQHQQQQQQQQQLQQQQQYALQQQANEPAWANIGFNTNSIGVVNTQQSQPQQQQPPSQPQQGVVGGSPSSELKDNPTKFYIVDAPDFLGLPMNVGSNGGATGAPTPNSLSQQQQPQQQQQQQPSVGSGGGVKQQESPISGELINFQNMWPTAGPTTSQMMFGGNTQQQQQQQQSQQQPQNSAQPGQGGSVSVSGVGVSIGGSDPHNYNNIGSILTNLIETNPPQMEYNFDLMQPGASQMGVSQSQQQHQQNSLSAHQQQQQQQQQQPQHTHSAHQHQPHPHQHQQHHSAAAAAAAGNYGAAGLIRHTSIYGSPSGASLYDTSAAAAAAAHHHHHLPSHHPSLADLSEQHQKNSFQPYHPHTASHSLSGHHPLAPTAHHPLAPHLLPPPPPHASIYDRGVGGGGYPAMLMGSGGGGAGGEEQKTVLPPISDYMHHIQQQQQQLQSQHPQQSDLVYYPVKND